MNDKVIYSFNSSRFSLPFALGAKNDQHLNFSYCSRVFRVCFLTEPGKEKGEITFSFHSGPVYETSTTHTQPNNRNESIQKRTKQNIDKIVD